MKSFLHKQAERFAYLRILLSLFAGWVLIKALILIAPILRKRKPTKDFLFFPYTHKDNIGTLARVQEYLPLLERDGYTYDVHSPFTRQEYQEIYYAPHNSRAYEYNYLRKLFWQRFNWILNAPGYKAVFYQRSLFPNFYNQHHAILEQLLRAIHKNITVDYFDADYVRNESLYKNVIKNCDKVAVVSHYLFEYFSKLHPRVLYNDLSVDASRYKIKSDYKLHQPVRIFWTGSANNAKQNLTMLMPLLEDLNKSTALKLVMICTSTAGFNYPFIEHHLWKPNTFFDLLADADVALYPVAEDNAFSRGKVAYKTLEYIASKVPIVASPHGLSSHLIKDEDVLVAENLEEWKEQLIRMLADENLRKRLADAAHEKLMKYHEVNATYKNLLSILNA